MKVVLTTGLIPKKKWFNFGSSLYTPPLGLGYLSAVLEGKEHETNILDLLPSQYSIEKAVKYILTLFFSGI